MCSIGMDMCGYGIFSFSIYYILSKYEMDYEKLFDIYGGMVGIADIFRTANYPNPAAKKRALSMLESNKNSIMDQCTVIKYAHRIDLYIPYNERNDVPPVKHEVYMPEYLKGTMLGKIYTLYLYKRAQGARIMLKDYVEYKRIHPIPEVLAKFYFDKPVEVKYVPNEILLPW